MTRKIKYPDRPLRFRALNLVIRYLPVSRKHSFNGILLRKTIDRFQAPAVPDDCEFREAGNEDIAFIARHPEALHGEVYNSRLRHGDRCYCLVTGGEVVSYNWINFTNCCSLCGFERGIEFFPLQPGGAFTYDFYTYTPHRGQGFGKITKNLVLQALKEEGIQEVYTLVLPRSLASLKIHLDMGYEPLTMVYGYRIQGWSRTFSGNPGNKLQLDEWIRAFRASAGTRATRAQNEHAA
jgi:GNAT superfamily N-acetyltransferase